MRGLAKRAALIILGLAIAGTCLPASAETPFITVASTTSTENSGLFNWILPKFKAATGIDVRVIAVGTGQALRLGERGDADIVFVHHRPSEDRFVAGGYGIDRYDVMYNDFILVGPSDDPAGIAGMDQAPAALAAISRSEAPFVSRGDDSGTHKKEMGLWHKASRDPTAASGTWYRELGSGMGATLNTAAALDAYTIADRGTWISFANKRSLTVLVEGDPQLFNPYGVILVNPARHPHVKAALAQAFIDWLISEAGQAAINAYTVDGQQLFYGNVRQDADGG